MNFLEFLISIRVVSELCIKCGFNTNETCKFAKKCSQINNVLSWEIAAFVALQLRGFTATSCILR